MRRTNLLSTIAGHLCKSISVCFLLAVAVAGAFAQTPTPDARPAATPPPHEAAPAIADEEFELNIDQRRISEKEFRAETSVETDGVRGLQLGIGVALRASEIEVLLSNVRGHVRFRGSLAPVLRLLEARRGPPTQTPPP